MPAVQPFCYITEHMDFLILIALTLDSAFALLQITGPPGTIQIMDRHKTILNIGACAHFGGTAQQHTHLPGAHLAEQLLFLDLRVGVVDKGNLLCRNAAGNQFGTNVIVNGEGGISFYRECGGFHRVDRNDRLFRFRRSLGCGNIAEHKLGQLVRLAVPPDLRRFHTGQ